MIKDNNVVIDENAFDKCTYLTEIALASVKRLECSVFWGCENLSEVNFDTALG